MKEKECAGCNRIKLLDEFEENQFSPDGRFRICKICFEKRMNRPPQVVKEENEDRKLVKTGVAPGITPEKKRETPEPSPKTGAAINRPPGPDDDDRRSREIRAAQQAILCGTEDDSRKLRVRLPKLRKCNGCRKIEPVGKTPDVPPTPVQAWFCDECIKNKRHQYVAKGHRVYDYWGRIYKVTRVVNHELVRGVVKKGDGRWSIRKFDIYGWWQTIKPA